MNDTSRKRGFLLEKFEANLQIIKHLVENDENAR